MPRICDYPDSTGLKDTDRFVVDDMTEDQTLSYTGAMLKEYVNDNRTSSVAAFEEVNLDSDFVMLQNEDTGAHSRISVGDFKEVVNDIRTASIMAFTEAVVPENGIHFDVQNGNTGRHSKIAMADVDTYIKGLITGLYRFRGSVTFANLPALSTTEVGDVYNIKDGFMTTSDFIEGPGVNYSAGSNVVFTDQNKWDVMGGMTIDLSDYATFDDLQRLKKATEDYSDYGDANLQKKLDGIVFEHGLNPAYYNIDNPMSNIVFLTAPTTFVWSDSYPRSFTAGSRMILVSVCSDQNALIDPNVDNGDTYQFAVINDHILASRSRLQNENGVYSWQTWTESNDDITSFDAFRSLLHNGKAIKDPNLPESIISTINGWDNSVVFDHCPPSTQGHFMILLTVPLSGQKLTNTFCLQVAFYGDVVIKKTESPYIAYRCTKNVSTNEWEDWALVTNQDRFVGKVDNLTNFAELNRIGKWKIASIDNTYATSIGIVNNTGDFYADVLNYNGGKYGVINLNSPRLGAAFYMIQIWNGVSHAYYVSANDLYGSGLFNDAFHNNRLGINLTYNDLMKRRRGLTAFSNWNDTENFPTLYGTGLVFDAEDATHRYIFYTGVSRTWYGIVQNRQMVDPWPKPRWIKLIDSDMFGVKLINQDAGHYTRIVGTDPAGTNGESVVSFKAAHPTRHGRLTFGSQTNNGDVSLPFSFGVDANGNYGYYKKGADTVTPFKSGGSIPADGNWESGRTSLTSIFIACRRNKMPANSKFIYKKREDGSGVIERTIDEYNNEKSRVMEDATLEYDERDNPTEQTKALESLMEIFKASDGYLHQQIIDGIASDTFIECVASKNEVIHGICIPGNGKWFFF